MEERISGWLAKVPGYTGYRSKENQRDEDKRIREAISTELNAVADRLTRVGAELAAKRKLDQISEVESALADTRHLADRIRNASYGYGGIFTERPIDDVALEQLRQFDLALQREADSLSAVTSGVTNGDGLRIYLDELESLKTLFNSRMEVVDTGRATSDQKTLALLDRPVSAKPSPLLRVSVGDALSVLGENFTVDATIELKYKDAIIKLIRISGDKQTGERWLLGSSSIESMPSADLIETSGSSSLATTGPSSAVPATMSVSGPQGSGAAVPASYSYAKSGDSGVSLEINVGGEVRSFTGRILNDIDVEIYGPTATK